MTKIIAITGGKGGTGKSTVSTALASELSRENKVLLIDADTDCPDDHLIMSIKRKKEKDIFQIIPKWDNSKCIKCGKCAEVCRENAILFIKNKYPVFVEDLCNGCSSCMRICPTNAIGKSKKTIGTVYSGKRGNLNLITAEMKIGHEESAPVVNALKKFALKNKEDYDYILIDTAAGAHCNVISALIGCEKALAVTEPTPLGAHDLDLILQLCKKLEIPADIVLNRADIGNKELIQDIAGLHDCKIIAEIPYKKEIIESYSKGKTIKHESIKKIAELI